MANFFYIDANGQKQGPVNDEQLKTLAAKGIITPNTPLETESGHKGTAGQIPGLFAAASSPFAQTASESKLFCTNCGNAILEQAVACMSCGAAPGGHKKFCRRCGVGLNPEQIICINCGAGVRATVVTRPRNENTTAQSTNSSTKNRITTVLFAFFLGGFGAHWFYLGNNPKALLRLGLTVGGSILAAGAPLGLVLICGSSVLAIIDFSNYS